MSVRERRALSAVLMLMLLGGAAPAAEPSWRELLNQAEVLSRARKSGEAAAAAQSALEGAEKSLGPKDPEVGHILSRLSEFYLAAGFRARLPEMEKRLSAFEAKDFEVWVSLGDVLREEGKSGEAEGALKKALGLKPDDPGAEYALARVCEDIGRFNEEIPLLERMIERQPGDYSLYSELAHAYISLGRPAEAEVVFARAKKIKGETSKAYIEEGYFYLNSGDLVQAKKEFRSAIAFDPSSPAGYHHMGSYLINRHRYPEAERYFRRALEKYEADPDAFLDDRLHTMSLLGSAIEAQGRHDEAETVYLQALKLVPPGGRPSGLLHWLEKLYADEGKIPQAAAMSRRIAIECGMRLKCLPQIVEARIDLGWLNLNRGRRGEAEVLAERAENMCEAIPPGPRRFHALRKVADLYAGLGDISKDKAIYNRVLPMRRALPFDPDLAWVERGLADVDEARGRFPQAEDHLRLEIRILNHNGYWRRAVVELDALAVVYARDGKRAAEDAAREQAKTSRLRND